MADEFESYLDPELVTVKIIFTPQITGERGRDWSMGYYGSLAAASLNAEWRVKSLALVRTVRCMPRVGSSASCCSIGLCLAPLNALSRS